MRLFLLGLTALTLSGCVPAAIENSRPIGFDAYLDGERGGYLSPAPSKSPSTNLAAKPDPISIPEYTFTGRRKEFGAKISTCTDLAGIDGGFNVQLASVNNKTHRWVHTSDSVSSTQAHIANKCLAS